MSILGSLFQVHGIPVFPSDPLPTDEQSLLFRAFSQRMRQATPMSEAERREYYRRQQEYQGYLDPDLDK